MKKVLIIFALLIGSLMTFAQSNRYYRYYEYQFGVGTSHYFGDIGGPKTYPTTWLGKNTNIRDFDPFESRLSLNAGIRYVATRNWAFSAQINPTWLAGNDSSSMNKSRGWSFNSLLLEVNAQAEYYPIKWGYLFAGTGFGPMYSVTNRNSVLDTSFSTVGVLLGGLGYRHTGKVWSQSVDIGVRYSLNDLIETFAGGTNKNDFYYLVQFKLIKKLTYGTIYNRHGLLIKQKHCR